MKAYGARCVMIHGALPRLMLSAINWGFHVAANMATRPTLLSDRGQICLFGWIILDALVAKTIFVCVVMLGVNDCSGSHSEDAGVFCDRGMWIFICCYPPVDACKKTTNFIFIRVY